MAEAAVRAIAWVFVGAFSVLLIQAWLVQRASVSAVSGRGLPMIVKLLAYAVIAAAILAYAACTWADYAVSSSIRRATGG